MCSCLGAKDPKALENLVNSMNVKTESVNRDLTSYKGILSKLSAAKELMAELMAREKRKQGERYVPCISVHVYTMYHEGLGYSDKVLSNHGCKCCACTASHSKR